MFSNLITLYSFKQQLLTFTYNDILNQYRGTFLGMIWVFIFPLLMLTLFTFVFGFIFQARWGSELSLEHYILMLFCGLILYQCFSDSLTKSSSAIISYSNYIKKIAIPSEIFPISKCITSIFNLFISLIILLIFSIYYNGFFYYTTFLLPFFLIPFFLTIFSFSLIISSISVFLRDLIQIVTFSMSVLFFISPILYPVTSLPIIIQKIIIFNPLTLPIEITRKLLIQGQLPDMFVFCMYFVISLFLLVIGYKFFKSLDSTFPEVI